LDYNGGYDVAVKGLSVVVRGIGGNGYNGMEREEVDEE
jgi:hypothetical protein